MRATYVFACTLYVLGSCMVASPADAARKGAKPRNTAKSAAKSATKSTAPSAATGQGPHVLVGARVLTVSADGAEITLNRGTDDGLRVGERGVVVHPNRKKAGATSRSVDSMVRLARGAVVSVQPSRAVVQLRLRTGAVQPGDYAAWSAKLPATTKDHSLLRLAAHDVGLLALADGKPFYELSRLLRGDETAPIWAAMAAEIKRNIHLAPKVYTRPIAGGRFHGMTLKEAFTRTTASDLRDFVDFVVAFPGKYIGKDWKLVNVYATWIINRTQSGAEARLKRVTAPLIKAAKDAEAKSDLAKAEAVWRSVLQAWPENKAAKRHLERIERVAVYDRALKRKPTDHTTRWLLAKALYRLRAHDLAKKALAELVQAKRDPRAARKYLAWILVREARFKEALVILNALVAERADPSLDKWIRYAKARQSIAATPGSFDAQMAIAKIDEEEGGYENAQRRLRQAADAATTTDQLALVQASQLRVRDLRRVESLGERIKNNVRRHDLTNVSRYATTLLQLAKQYRRLKRADTLLSDAADLARDVWERPTAELLQQSRVDLGHDTADALRDLAWVRYSGGELARARSALDHALRANNKSAYAHHVSGLIFLLQGDLSGAERQARAALEWSSTYPWPRQTLARVAVARSQWDIGIGHARDALKHAPTEADLQRALSTALALKRAAAPAAGDKRPLNRRRLHALRLWLRFHLYQRADRTLEMLRGTPYFDAACWSVLTTREVHTPKALLQKAVAAAEPSEGWQVRLKAETVALLALPDTTTKTTRTGELTRIDFARALVHSGAFHRAIATLGALTRKAASPDIVAMASDVANAARQGLLADQLVARAAEARTRGGLWPLVARLQREAGTAYQEIGSLSDAAGAAFFSAFAVAAQGNVTDALKRLEQVRTRYHGQLRPLAELDNRMAAAALAAQQGSLDAQYRVTEDGMRLCETLDEETCVAQMHLVRSQLHLGDGRLTQAKSDARYALTFAEERRMAELARRALFQLADAELVGAELVPCEEHGTALLARSREVFDAHHERLGLMLLGAVAMRRGDATVSQARFEEVRLLGARIGERSVQATALLSLGHSALNAAHKPAVAAVHYRAAATMWTQLADDERAGRSRYGLARALSQMGQRKEARTLLDAVIAQARKTGRKTLLADALVERAWVDVESGDPRAALPPAKEAYAITRLLDQDGALEAAHHVLGRALAGTGQTKEALTHLQAAAKILAKRVGRSGGEDAQRGFLAYGRTRRVYKDAIDLLLKAGRTNEAMAIIELSRDASLRKMFDPARIQTADKALKQTLGGLSAAERQADAARKQLATERARPDATQNAARIAALDKRVAENDANVRRLLLRLKARHHGLYQAFAVDPRNLVNNRHHLPDSALVLAYFLAGDDLYIFTIAKKRAQAHAFKVPLEGVDVGALVAKYREAIDKQNPRYKRLGRQLHKLLIAPVAHELAGVKTLLVMPTGPLYFLPFHALESKASGATRYLIEDHRVAYLLSTTIDELERPVRHGKRIRLAAFANPDGSLPGAKAEVMRLKRDAYPDATVFFGATADKARVLKEASRHHVLHFATHGVLDPDPLRSHLKMARGTLTVDDIAGIEFARDTTLIVLSACKTAVAVGKQMGEGISIAEAFATAGVPTLVASLWNVPDAATSELMSRFYTHLRAGKGDTLSALRAAQVELMRLDVGGRHPYSHPKFWAGFELIGDYR